MIAASELILNPDGSVYHLNLQPEQIADTIITVGDPDRVAAVSKHFDDIEHRVAKREFHTHTGRIGQKRITVISTGIGTDNVDIVLNELDALVNVDLNTRTLRKEHRVLDIIRIGTSGCLQGDIPLDSLLVSSHGLGLDGLGLYYDAPNSLLLDTIKERFSFPLPPYLVQGNEDLTQAIAKDFLRGITVTCAGFYAPQGRQIRAKSKMGDLLPALSDFSEKGLKITNFEMETAGIYLLAHLLGHRAISCNALIANRVKGTFSREPKAIVEKLITSVLESCSEL